MMARHCRGFEEGGSGRGMRWRCKCVMEKAISISWICQPYQNPKAEMFT